MNYFKKILCLILLCNISLFLQAKRVVSGKSFMFTRPASESIAMREQAWHIIKYQTPCYFNGLYSAVYGERSRLTDDVRRYFLFNYKLCLLVAGDKAPEDIVRARDIRAEWLKLPDNFVGELTMKPSQQQYGFFIGYNLPLRNVTSISFLQDSWIDIFLPLTYVRNNPHLIQKNVSNPGSLFPRDILEAFNNPEWRYSRIDGSKHRFSPADLRIELGKTYMAEDFFEIAYYSVALLPLSAEQDPAHFFGPVVGYNGHAGCGGGVTMQIPLGYDDCQAVSIFMDLESIFLFHRRQKRTFDIRDRHPLNGTYTPKPWSRFMLYNLQDGPAQQNIPGVNLLTLCAESRPYGVADFCTGFRLSRVGGELELGYGIWGHGAERLKVEKPINGLYPFGIAGEVNAQPPGNNNPITANNSTIKTQSIPDNRFIPISIFEIDRCSAESPTTVLQRVHLAGSYAGSTECAQFCFGGGVFFEFVQTNNPLPMWGAWLSGGAIF